MSYWTGKKAVFNGDSIMYGWGLAKHTEEAFPYLVAKKLGLASIKNYAISGTTASKHPEDYDEAIVNWEAFQAQRDAGLLDTQKAYLVRDESWEFRPYRIYRYVDGGWAPGGDSNIATGRTPLIDRIREMDTDADLVVVMVSANDFFYDWNPLGDLATNNYRHRDALTDVERTTTFVNAMHEVCRYLLATYRNKDVVLMTGTKLTQENGLDLGEFSCRSPEEASNQGLTQDDYRQSILEIGAYYSLPVIDLYAIAGLNPHITPEFFCDPNANIVHPNKAGHERLASVVAAKLLALRA